MLLTQKSRSAAQIAASRANGAKSRSPVTIQGRINSGKHKITHGLLARTVVLETENMDRFHDLLNSLVATYQPLGPTESVLIEKMAAAHWRLLRLWCHQKCAYGLEFRKHNANLAPDDRPTFDLVAFQSMSSNIFNRVENTYDLQFSRALRLLRSEQSMYTRTQHLIENRDQTLESRPKSSPV
jgi:hypothetical protein